MHPTPPDRSHPPEEVGAGRPDPAQTENRARTLATVNLRLWASVLVLAVVFIAVIVWFAAG